MTVKTRATFLRASPLIKDALMIHILPRISLTNFHLHFLGLTTGDLLDTDIEQVVAFVHQGS